MKSYFIAILSLLTTQAFALEGSLGKVSIGEIDPYVVGDACVIEIQTDAGLAAIVADYFECVSLTDAKGETFFEKAKGTFVTISESALAQPKGAKKKEFGEEVRSFVGDEKALVFLGKSDALEQIAEQIGK